jgi:hypothetical protein
LKRLNGLGVIFRLAWRIVVGGHGDGLPCLSGVLLGKYCLPDGIECAG